MTRESIEKTDLPTLHTPNLGRRSALRLGAGVAPILMTLVNRSAFACHSTTPSAFGSINASRPDVLQALSGKSPGYWKNHTGADWPSPYISHNSGKKAASTFNTVFGTTGSPFQPTTTLLAVLESNGGGAIAVARACVAALLNAQSARTSSVLPVSEVIQMWFEFASRGYYEPTAGIKWYADYPTLPSNGIANTGGKGGIIGYLNTTWT